MNDYRETLTDYVEHANRMLGELLADPITLGHYNVYELCDLSEATLELTVLHCEAARRCLWPADAAPGDVGRTAAAADRR
jgi:hypothetical protein